MWEEVVTCLIAALKELLSVQCFVKTESANTANWLIVCESSREFRSLYVVLRIHSELLLLFKLI